MSRFVSSLRSSLNERGLSDRGPRHRLRGRGLSSSLNDAGLRSSLLDAGLRSSLLDAGLRSPLHERGLPFRSLSERSETKRAPRQRGKN